jgi:anti-sigma factor RsiW
MSVSKSGDRILMLNAALDSELDAAGMIDMERQLVADPTLAADYARLKALRQAVRTHASREAAPAQLRTRIAALAGAAAPADKSASLTNWRGMAASIAAAAILATGVYTWSLSNRSYNETTQAVVAGFMRAQISGRPVDVISSDRHTVKPWLAGKAPMATVVVDLDSEGFPLAGGRVDIVAGVAAPTLVYKRREHFISVTELTPTQIKYPNAPKRETIDGYYVSVWADGDRSYAAVSDLPPAELDSFVVTFRRAVANERENAGPHSTVR